MPLAPPAGPHHVGQREHARHHVGIRHVARGHQRAVGQRDPHARRLRAGHRLALLTRGLVPVPAMRTGVVRREEGADHKLSPLARTTRSVAPTDAGEELLRSLRPALTGIRAALGKIAGQRDKPAGRVRLVVSFLAAGSVLGPKLGDFARNYPDVVLDITTDQSRVDLVAGHRVILNHLFAQSIQRLPASEYLSL